MKFCTILQRSRGFLLLLPVLTVLATLTGCGIGTMSPADTSVSGEFAISGKVFGGNLPVSGSTIQLYTAGTSGNGSTATPMLTSAVTTNPNGGFTITGYYTCVHSTDQVYLTSTGGNPGLSDPTTNNTALVMLVAIGNCGQLGTTVNFINVNEVTTAAAVYALAPFISTSTTAPYFNIGASSTNATGLANAFLNAQLLANTATGVATTLPSGLTTQPAKLYALADALSYCVNSTGATTPSTAACPSLVSAATPNGGTAPAATTIATALSIVRHPGDVHIVPAVWNLINSQAPFPTTPLTQAPSDWSMTLTITTGGLNEPAALGIDKIGNAWVASYNGVLSAFSPQGTAFNSTGYGIGTLNECFGLTIDTSGNIWVANYELPTHSLPKGALTKFLGANSVTPGSIVTNNSTNYFTDSSIYFPVALTADTNGNIAIANEANSSASIYNPTTNTWTGGLGASSASTPLAIAFDSTHGLWLANYGNSSVTHVSSSGSILSSTTCCNGADGIAVDASGNAWIANYSGQYVYAVNSSGSRIANATGGGLSTTNSQPVGVAVDAAQNIWIADGNGGVITQLSPFGFPVSPSTGYGVDAKLGDPKGIGLDASGNVWTADYSKNTVVMFFGIATPTVTPVQPVPTAP